MIYAAFSEKDQVISTSITGISKYFGINDGTIRNKFNRYMTDRITVKGIVIIRCELLKIVGRGGFN